jgi:hypothetical protein
MKSGIYDSLKKAKGGRSWEDIVDFTLGELKLHLESQFLPGMSWSNHGKWHIDHIRPQASFNFKSPEDKEFKECWALSNLQPLWAIDNFKKGDRWNPTPVPTSPQTNPQDTPAQSHQQT